MKPLYLLLSLLLCQVAYSQVPAVPTIQTLDTTCYNTSITLTASAPIDPDIEFQWFATAFSFTPLFTGNPFVSPVLTTDRSYFVRTRRISTGQTSARREVVVDVSSNFTNNPLTGLPNPIIDCSPINLNITFTLSPPLAQIRWFDQSVGGNDLGFGTDVTPWIVPDSANPTTVDKTVRFYYQGYDDYGCPAQNPRRTFDFVIKPEVANISVNPLKDTICSGDAFTFTSTNGTVNGSNPSTSYQYLWFSDITGATQVNTGITYSETRTNGTASPVTEKYYLYGSIDYSDLTISSRQCFTPFADSVEVLINPLPSNATTLSATPNSICSGESVTLAGTASTAGSTIIWYRDAAKTDTIGFGVSINSGTLTNGGILPATRTLYAETISAEGCTSPSTSSVNVTVNPSLVLPPVALANNVLVCNGDSVQIGVTIGTAVQYYWYDTPGSSTPLDSGNTFTTPILTNAGVANLVVIFYVEGKAAGGCRSARTPITVLVRPALDIPLVNPNPAAVCSGEGVTLTASSAAGGTIFRWFDSQFNGTLLHTGSTYTTGPITNSTVLPINTTYYVEVEDANGCVSLRTAAVVITRPALDLPLVNPPVATICAGDSIDLTASSLLGGGVTYNWYDGPTGGPIIFTGPVFNTGPIANSGTANLLATFFVELTDATGCVSARTPAVITITPAVDLPIVTPPVANACSGDTVQFVATSLLGTGVTFRWYDALTGGTLLAINDTINYEVQNLGAANIVQTIYVEVEDANGCVSVRVPAVITILPALDVVLVNPPAAVICNGDSVEFTASNVTATAPVFEWYDDPLNGTLVYTGAVFNTGPLTNASGTDLIVTYYVQVTDGNGCESVRTPVAVTIRPAALLPISTPAAANVCSGDSVEFVASSLDPNGTYHWYDALVGGTRLFTGDTFVFKQTNPGTTDLIQTVYLELETAEGCVSIRIPVIITILPAAELPLVNPPVSVVCSGESATYVASTLLGTPGTFNWYTDIASGTPLFTGATFTTPGTPNAGALDLIQDYFVEFESLNGCKSIRIPVTEIVRPAIALPVPNPPLQTICNGSSAEFTATIIGIGDTLKWYDAIVGGTLLHVGDTFNTGVINNTNTTDLINIYYVEAVDTAGCTSLRVPVTVIVRPTIEVPLVDPLVSTLCSGDSATLTASSLLGLAESEYYWFDAIVGGNPLDTGAIFNTGALTNTGVADIINTYYVEVEDTAGCRSIRTLATVIITPAVNLPIVTPATAIICNGSANEFIATNVLNEPGTYYWYDETDPVTPIFVGDTFVTGQLPNTGSVPIIFNFYVEFENAAGCKSLRLNVPTTVLPKPLNPTVMPNPGVFCAGDTANFTVQPNTTSAHSLNWYANDTISTPFFTGSAYQIQGVTANGTAPDTNTFYVEVEQDNGCRSYREEVTYIVNPSGQSALVRNPIDSICDGTSGSFEAYTPIAETGSFEWYTVGTSSPVFIGNNYTTPVYNNGGPGEDSYEFFVLFNNQYGCPGDTAFATAVVAPEVQSGTPAALDSDICHGEEAVLYVTNPTAGNTYRWYDAVDATILSFEGDTFRAGVLTTSTTAVLSFYMRTVNSFGCESDSMKVDVTVRKNNQVLSFTDADSSYCPGDQALITVESDGPVSDFEWYEQPMNTLVNNGVLFATNPLTDTVSFNVFSVDIYGCSSDAYPLRLNVVKEDSLVAPIIACNKEDLNNNESKITWDIVNGATGYEVSTDSGATWMTPSTGANGTQHLEANILDRNKITFMVRTTNNAYICQNTVSVASVQTCDVKLDLDPINNSFSPNGDGVNDGWVISKAIDNYPENSVEIFNRWGDKVWETKNYNNVSNNFTGSDLESGTYFYVIKVSSINLEKSGYVMIVR